MPTAAPINRSFNGGLWSPLMQGRVDNERYAASCQEITNYLLAPQGPLIRRSGTRKVVPLFDENKTSRFIPFVVSNATKFNLEVTDTWIRFATEAGLLAYTSVAIGSIDNVAPAVKFVAAGHGCTVGDQVVLGGFAFNTGLNGEVGNVINVSADTIVTDIPRHAGTFSVATATMSKVYKIASVYTQDQLASLRYVQSVDDLRIFCAGKRPYLLRRYNTYDWRLTPIDFVDGPFAKTNTTATTITPSATGNPVPIMTANALPSGAVTADSVSGAGHDAFMAFDDNRETFWEGNVNQVGWLAYTFTAPVVVDGYYIEVAKNNDSADYAAVDYAPGTWTFEAYDGANWIVLDSKVGYVVYDSLRSFYFKLPNATAYIAYRINITALRRNGPIKPRIGRLVVATRATASITLTASAIDGINSGQGFLATDVGRQFRWQGTDGAWRALTLTGWTSVTVMTAALQAEPLNNVLPTTQWRLGLWSDTTGFPTCGVFHEDRLFLNSGEGYPDTLAGSVVGAYETFSQTDVTGQVNDDNGLVLTLNARKLSQVNWLQTDEKALLVGAGAGEWTIGSSDTNSALTGGTAKARNSTARGSAPIEPAKIDRQILFVQRSAKTLREMAYVFAADGYNAPSMSLFASSISAPSIRRLEYAAEPHSILWCLLGDGNVAGFTYNREENVIGWHLHTFGGFVEDISVMPSGSGAQDVLWLSIRRVIDGHTRRFMEVVEPTWMFESTLADAFFVDCGLRYVGAPITTIYGARHLNGATVYGLADGAPFGPKTVVDGSFTLDYAASNVVFGIGFRSRARTARAEAGSADGTAQGKKKRINRIVFRMWSSVGGQYGFVDEEGNDQLETIEQRKASDLTGALALFTGDTDQLTFPNGYEPEGSILIQQPADVPLPHNVVAIMPKLQTQG